jgi:predicted RNA-binding protein with PUA-like domain
MQYWLVKTEPETFSWQDLVTQKKAVWDGVRNYTARNHLKAMQVDDLVLIYHSVTGKEVVGFGRVVTTAYQDPTTDDERWVAVEIIPVTALPTSVSLADIKAEPALADLPLIKQSRLSVMPVDESAFKLILQKGGL